jgi:hypothetical protein
MFSDSLRHDTRTDDCCGLGQANAEPDLQQTGDRLRGFISGLVEGILQLVVDPLAESADPCALVTSS